MIDCRRRERNGSLVEKGAVAEREGLADLEGAARLLAKADVESAPDLLAPHAEQGRVLTPAHLVLLAFELAICEVIQRTHQFVYYSPAPENSTFHDLFDKPHDVLVEDFLSGELGVLVSSQVALPVVINGGDDAVLVKTVVALLEASHEAAGVVHTAHVNDRCPRLAPDFVRFARDSLLVLFGEFVHRADHCGLDGLAAVPSPLAQLLAL